MSDRVDQQVVRAIPWSVVGVGVNRAIAVLSTLVLARLLVSVDFGEFALALLVVTGMTQIAGLGLSGAAIRAVDYGRPERAAYLQLIAFTGAAGALLLVALAGPLAALFDVPGLADVIRVLAVVVLIEELAGVLATDLARQLRFRQLAIIEMGRTAVTAAVAIGLAATGSGVWSLALGHLAGTIVLLACLLVVAPALAITAPGAGPRRRALLRDGRGFLLQRVTTFAELNVDYLLVGAIMGARALGFYSMAYRLSELPANGVAEPVARVTFPRFSQLHDDPATLSREAITALQIVTAVAIVPAVLLSATARPFVEAALGSSWLPMVAALEVLGLWGAVRAVQTTQAWMLNATGRAAALGRAYVVQLLVTVPLLVLAAVGDSLVAVALVMLAAQLGMAIVAARMVARDIAGLAAQWQVLRVALAGGAVLWAVAHGTVSLAAPWAAGLQLAAGVAAGVVAYLGVIWTFDPRLIPRAVGMFRRTGAAV